MVWQNALADNPNSQRLEHSEMVCFPWICSATHTQHATIERFIICIQGILYLHPGYSLFVFKLFTICIRGILSLRPKNSLFVFRVFFVVLTTHVDWWHYFCLRFCSFLVAGVYSCFTSERSLSYKILLMYKNHRFGKWKNIAYKFVHFFVSTKCMIAFRCRSGCSTCPTDLVLLFWCHPFFSLSATCLSQKAISCASTWHFNRWSWSNISILLACTLSLFTLLLTEGAAKKSAWARSTSFLNRASASRSQCCPTYKRLLSAVTTSV